MRATSLAYSLEEKVLGTVSVSSPVLGPDREVIAAVAVIARVGARLERIAPAVRTAALGITRALAPAVAR